MAAALTLGRRGLGACSPNPSVGCLIVQAGRVVGRGRTGDGGRPHGEVLALEMAGDAAHGATAYVTLEPCAHHGQTPPCADALIAAGIARVVIAHGDPDPRVAGQGIARLRAAGLEVVEDVMADSAAWDHAGFFSRVTQGRPMVTLKLATSFDGRTATGSGQSQWITGALARRGVHAMRSNHDAVMVGGGTARQDDPSLTVRDLGVARQPARIVVSRRLDLPLQGKLALTARDVPLILCHGPDADPELQKVWQDLGATLLPCRLAGQDLDMSDVLAQLGAHGLTRVFCEGGAALGASLIANGLVDRLVGFTAGLMIGAEGWPAIGALGLGQLAQAARFDLVDVRPVGADILHVWQVREPDG